MIPMHELFKCDITGRFDSRHVRRFRKLKRQNNGAMRPHHIIESPILFTRTKDDNLQPEFFADGVGSQEILLIGCFQKERLFAIHEWQQSLQGHVRFRLGNAGLILKDPPSVTVPLSVIESLSQQSDGPHRRIRVSIPATRSRHRQFSVHTNSFDEHGTISTLIRCGDQRADSLDNPSRGRDQSSRKARGS